MRYEFFTALFSCVLLTGCIDQSLKEEECQSMAEDRMDLYNKMDISQASEQEKKAAQQALYNKCISEDSGYRYEVDNRNAIDSGQAAPNVPNNIIMTDQPPVIPVASPRLQQYAPPNKELLNILTKSN